MEVRNLKFTFLWLCFFKKQFYLLFYYFLKCLMHVIS